MPQLPAPLPATSHVANLSAAGVTLLPAWWLIVEAAS